MEQVQAAALRQADEAERRILALWDRHEAGDIDRARFAALGASIVAQLNASGVQLADLGVTDEITRQLRRPTQPLGLQPDPVAVDQDRIAGNLSSLADEPIDAPDEQARLKRRERIGALARSEPLVTVAGAVTTAMTSRDASGWTRRTDLDPCDACSRWADGVVRPAGTTMKRHRGCACIQQPVFRSPDEPVPEPPSQQGRVDDLMAGIEESMARARASGAADSITDRVTDTGFLET